MRVIRRFKNLAIGLVIVLAPPYVLGAEMDEPATSTSTRLKAEIQKILGERSEEIQVKIWIGGPTGGATFALGDTSVMPTASAIKTAFLVEWFAEHRDALDQPLPGLDQVLADDHPAIAHFTPKQREEIREGLQGASVRRLGGIMMGPIKVSNVVYNAAANVITALLGGPQRLTDRIHQRDPAFAPIQVRRYMLADRVENGDNEATPAALAAVLQRLAERKLRGVDTKLIDEIRNSISHEEKSEFGPRYWKGGALNSDPITRVESGWYDAGEHSLVYCVMTSQANLGGQEREKASETLNSLCKSITATLTRQLRPATSAR